MRTFEFPHGLPNLTPIRRKLVQLANKLSEVTLRASLAQVRNTPGLLVIEFPEDLGAIAHGDWFGRRPASLWQLPQVQELLQQEGVTTCGLRMRLWHTLCQAYQTAGQSHIGPRQDFCRASYLLQQGFLPRAHTPGS